MIDTGLVVTMIVIAVGCSLLLRIAPPTGGDRDRIYDLAIGPLFIGIIVARLVAMAFDDLGRALRLRDVLLLRSGMEFWAGLAAALAFATWRWRKDPLPRWGLLAAVIPYGLWTYALYEGTCLVRDGCLGPRSPIGLTPIGLSHRVFPVGLAVAAATFAIGFILRRARLLRPETVVAIGLGSLAGVRAVASVWLPAIGPSRIQRESIAVALLVPVVWALDLVRRRVGTANGKHLAR